MFENFNLNLIDFSDPYFDLYEEIFTCFEHDNNDKGVELYIYLMVFKRNPLAYKQYLIFKTFTHSNEKMFDEYFEKRRNKDGNREQYLKFGWIDFVKDYHFGYNLKDIKKYLNIIDLTRDDVVRKIIYER